MVGRHKHPISHATMFVSSCCPYDIDDLASDTVGINVLYKVVEAALQRRMTDSFLNISG